MKYFLNIKYITLVCIIALTSCSPKEEGPQDCLSFKKEFVTNVNAPSTATVNETTAIEVEFTVNNGCGGFEKFIQTGTQQSKIIEVEARYEGCYCTMVIQEITELFYFTPTTTGNFELKFLSGENEYIIVNIFVS